MQAAICDSVPETMTEKRVELYILERLEGDQRLLVERVSSIDTSLTDLGREVSEIKGSIKPQPETPAWMRFFIYPCCVLIAGVMVGAVITLLVKVNGIETFIHNNGGVIAGLRLEKLNSSDPQKAQEAEQILAQAKKAKIKIPPEVVESTGRNFIHAAQTSSSA